MCVLLSSDPRRGCARDIKVTVPPRLRFESVGMMCWLHNNNSNKLSLTHWPKWSKDIKRIDRFFSRNLGSHRDASAWITVNTVNMQSILSYRVLPKGAWDTFASQRDTDGWNHSWELSATVSQSSPGNLCKRVIVYGHTMDLSPLEEGTREQAAQRLRRVRKP